MRKAVLAVGLIVIALAGLVFLLPMAINSDTLRTALARQLSEASGAQIALNGPIHFSVVPDFGIVAEDLSYTTADGALSVTAQRSVASAELLPLLSGQVRISGIDLKSPRIVLADAAAPAQPEPESAAAAPAGGEDVFKTIAGYLERLSINNVVVSDGEVARNNGGAIDVVASAIEIHLSAPGISQPASLSVSGLMGGKRMELAAEIGSLQNLLARQPAEFSLSEKAEQPLHPMLADIRASGRIQLADDGSYRIAGGEIESRDQKMQLDASYTPGDRPFVVARIAAGTLDYSDFQPAVSEAQASADQPAAAPSGTGGVDLSALRDLDADIELRAAALKAGDAVASDVVIAAQLNGGKLTSTVSSGQIAGGSLAASLAMDVNADVPQASGSFDASSIDIASLMALAGQQTPTTGTVSSQLLYAFRGLDIEAIRNSLNLRGDVSISGGRVDVPQLAGIAGKGAGVVDALEATVKIDNVRQPLALSGTAQWNGQAIGFTTSLALSDLMWEQPAKVAAALKSKLLNASFSGTVTPNAGISGKADISAPSLTRAAAWLGQNLGTPLGQFAFSGGVAASSSELAITKATIGLDDIHAGGSVSVALTGKPKITAALSVDTLDFGKLVGGGGENTASVASGPTPIDLSVLRLFDADIRLDAKQLGYGKVVAGPATATLAVANGVARLAVPQAGFYKGTLTANVVANGSGETPAIELAAGMDGVAALPLLTAAAGFDRLEGSLKAEVKVSGTGANTEAFARSLNGPVNVVFSDGAIRGIDVAGLVRNVQSLINAGYKQDSEAKTEFTELSVAVNIQNGVGQANDIRLLGPFVRMSGKGSVDLAGQTIDMTLDPRVVGSLDGQGGDFDVSGLGMPIIVKGPLSGPSIYPDISGILADPNRALQALTQMGGGVGDLANKASGALGSLGQSIGDKSGGTTDGIVTGILGNLGNNGGTGANGAPAGNQEAVNSLLQGIFGQQQAQPATEIVETPASTGPAPTSPLDIPLPKSDPRGIVASAPPPEEEEPASPADQLVDAIVPQSAPDGKGGTNDLIKGLINQIGM